MGYLSEFAGYYDTVDDGVHYWIWHDDSELYVHSPTEFLNDTEPVVNMWAFNEIEC